MKNSKLQVSFWGVLPLLLIGSGIVLAVFRLKSLKKDRPEDTQAPAEEENPNNDDDEPSLSQDETILQIFKLIRANVPDSYSDNFVIMMLAQAMHETGIFTSRLYNEQNNLFGMRHPSLRQTKSLGSLHDYANFSDLQDSVKDQVLYFDHMKISSKQADVREFVKDLKAHYYFTAPFVPYFNAVRSHYNYAKSLIN